jgi:hypothetical protein
VKTVPNYFGRLTYEQREKLRRLGGSQWIGKVIDSIANDEEPLKQLVAQLEARIAEAEITITFLRTENVRIRRGALPSCCSCGGWIKPEQGGQCMPCLGESSETVEGKPHA